MQKPIILKLVTNNMVDAQVYVKTNRSINAKYLLQFPVNV